MFLSQTIDGAVIWRVGDVARTINNTVSTYELASSAINAGQSVSDIVGARGLGDEVDLSALLDQNKLISPIGHPDPAHLHLTGTGLTHLGSAETRDSMHVDEGDMELSDSMRMFQMGLKGGKPAPGTAGVQPEWFYKGTGNSVVAPGAALTSPSFALDGGEEPEIAGIYIIAPNGTPFRLGFAVANEFSDHVLERQNYLYLAHSKLRPASFGPEIRVSDLPSDVQGTSRILRNGQIIWEKPFLSGEDNMSHTIANLEYHHFKYGLFRQPGDLHVHMFGTATLSFADNIQTEIDDVFEIAVPDFGLPLRNPLAQDSETSIQVKEL